MSDWATRYMKRPNAFLQWKGTDVCMDVYCLCGEDFHVDAYFAYAVKCPHCGQVHEMSAMIEARPLADGEVWKGCIVEGEK
jgi:hypothetical protein